MKEEPRGPFAAIRWFCKDGRVLPPRITRAPRRARAGSTASGATARSSCARRATRSPTCSRASTRPRRSRDPAFPDAYAQLLIERFLIATGRRLDPAQGAVLPRCDPGRGRARGGAQPAHGDGGTGRLDRLSLSGPAGRRPASAAWRRYRVGAESAEHGGRDRRSRSRLPAAAGEDPRLPGRVRCRERARVRGEARRSRAEAAGRRARGGDRSRVRAAAAGRRARGEREGLRRRAVAAGDAARRARRATPRMAARRIRYLVTAKLLASLRDALPKVKSPAARLRVLDLSLAVEAENFRAAAELRSAAAQAPRGADVLVLAAGVEAAYGTGAINGRERAELRKSVARLAADEIPLADYLRELRYLGLVPGWGTQGLRLHFGEAMEKLGEIEPLAGAVHPGPAARQPAALLLPGARRPVARREPPGGRAAQAVRARHRRRVQRAQPRPRARRAARIPDMKRLEDFRPDGIYVLPETVADLPPLAGHPDGGRGQSALARAAPRAQPRHPERRGGPVAAAGAAPERRQAHRARGEPGRPRPDRRRRSAVGRGVRQGGEGGREHHVRARPQEARPLGARLRAASTSCARRTRAGSSARRRRSSAS